MFLFLRNETTVTCEIDLCDWSTSGTPSPSLILCTCSSGWDVCPCSYHKLSNSTPPREATCQFNAIVGLNLSSVLKILLWYPFAASKVDNRGRRLDEAETWNETDQNYISQWNSEVFNVHMAAKRLNLRGRRVIPRHRDQLPGGLACVPVCLPAGRDPNCIIISHCSQTVPSRSWNVPCEIFMHHIFLHRLDPVFFQGPYDSQNLHRWDVSWGTYIYALAWVLTMRLSRPRGWANHLCLTIAPAILIFIPFLSTETVYIAQVLCSYAAHSHDRVCPALSPYPKSLITRSVCKQPWIYRFSSALPT